MLLDIIFTINAVIVMVSKKGGPHLYLSNFDFLKPLSKTFTFWNNWIKQ